MKPLVLSLFAVALVTAADADPTSDRGTRNCVNFDRVVGRTGVSDRMLELDLTGGRRVRSTLPDSCPHLTEIDRSYVLQLESFTGPRVCSGDRFRVIDLRAGGPAAASSFTACRFGRFENVPQRRH